MYPEKPSQSIQNTPLQPYLSIRSVCDATRTQKETETTLGKTIKVASDVQAFAAPVPASRGQDNWSQEGSLEKLLTVFSKTPQSKFDGCVRQPKSEATSNKPLSTVNVKISTQQVYRTDSNRINPGNLTASVSATLRKNKQLTSAASKSTTLKHNESRSKSLETNFSRSFGKTTQNVKISRISTSSFSIAKILNVCEFEKSLLTTAPGFSLPKHRSYDGDLGFTLVPELGAHWPGSLGTLYRRAFKDAGTKKFPTLVTNESKAIDAAIFSSAFDLTEATCDNGSSSTDQFSQLPQFFEG